MADTHQFLLAWLHHNPAWSSSAREESEDRGGLKLGEAQDVGYSLGPSWSPFLLAEFQLKRQLHPASLLRLKTGEKHRF